MKFKHQIAKYITGNLSTSQLPEVAILGLEEGFESDSLLILASFGKNDNSFEINEYFEKTIAEINLELPEKRQAAIIYAEGIVDDIINGKIEIIQGISEIKNNAIDSFDFYSETKKYCYDSIGFEAIYGLFVTYNDLLEADSPWKMFKSNKKLMLEVKAELLLELKKMAR